VAEVACTALLGSLSRWTTAPGMPRVVKHVCMLALPRNHKIDGSACKRKLTLPWVPACLETKVRRQAAPSSAALHTSKAQHVAVADKLELRWGSSLHHQRGGHPGNNGRAPPSMQLGVLEGQQFARHQHKAIKSHALPSSMSVSANCVSSAFLYTWPVASMVGLPGLPSQIFSVHAAPCNVHTAPCNVHTVFIQHRAIHIQRSYSTVQCGKTAGDTREVGD